MKTIAEKTKFFERNLFIIWLFILTFSILSVSAQENLSPQKELNLPADEIFKFASGLIRSGHNAGTRRDGESISSSHPKTTELQNIYDENGKLWYQFSIWFDTSLSITTNIKKEFNPFASTKSGNFDFYLRLVRESPNWYEVEINEETQETKYILKADFAFAKTDFNSKVGVGENAYVKVDNNIKSLLDAPDGNKISNYITEQKNDYKVLELKGDWIKVALNDGILRKEKIVGWVRWRDGRKMLVGLTLNGWKMP